MRKLLAAAFVLGATTSAATITEAAPQCGAPYVVVTGDTLSDIAQAAFTDASRWTDIYEFRDNSSAIGNNPNLIETGMRLDMPPCPTQLASVPPQPQARPAAVTTTTAPSVTGFVPKIDIVTGGDYTPFTDGAAPGRGMITQLVEAAFAASDLSNDVQIDFVNDWGSHLHLLIPRNKYDFGFPWIQPDCSNVAILPEDMKIRCEYEWSEPLYTFTVALFAPKTDPNPPASFSDLQGKIVCRPAGYYTFDLSERGLLDGETFTMSRPTTVAECFDLLERGRVDYVSINRFTGEKAVASAGLGDFIEPVRTLVDPRAFHLVAYRDNAEAAFTWMAEFNEGLDRIRANGVWDEIVNWHLERHRASLRP